MKKIIFFLIALCSVLISSDLLMAQTTSPTTVAETPPAFVGTVNLDISPDIEDLLSRYIVANQYQQIVQKGYRIQVSQNNNRDEIRRQELQIKDRFPQLATYEVYQAPTFKLRVGNFTSRFEAYSLFRQLKPQFSSAFIVEDNVLME